MNAFELSVVAVDRICYHGAAFSCTVATTTGSRTFEAHHAPFAAVLVPGTVVVVDDGGRRLSIPVEDGLVRFGSNACSIIVTLK